MPYLSELLKNRHSPDKLMKVLPFTIILFEESSLV